MAVDAPPAGADVDDATLQSQALAPLQSRDCAPPTPEGGWAPWAFDADGFKPFTVTLDAALETYDFEMPSALPSGFVAVDDMVSVVYMTGSDYTVHVLWQQPSRHRSGETVVMYVRHGSPYGGHEDGSVWWDAPSGVIYELASTDPDVSRTQLLAMACSMPSFPGPCRRPPG